MWLDPDDSEQKNQSTNSSGLGAPSVGAGGGVGQATGTTSNPSTFNPVQTNQPTQEFATVQDYLGANQQQGEALGQQFTGKLDTNLSNEKSAIDTAAGQTKSDVASGTVNYDPNLVATAASDPTKITNDPNQLGSFLKQWNASYSGPSSFENSNNYGAATTAANEAATKGAEASTTGGQQQLLQDNFGVYGQGNKGLDQNILQNSSYSPKVQDQAKQFGTVNDYLAQQAADVDTQATKAATDTAATQANTKGAFANKLADFQTGVNKEVSDAQNTATAQGNQYKADLASGDTAKIVADIKQANPNADASTIQQYLDAYTKDYGNAPDLSSQYTFNPAVQITPANAATAKDYANAAAYGQLTGQDFSGVIAPTNASQAATAPVASSAVNPANIQNYLKTQLDTKDKATLTTPINLQQQLNGTTDPAQAQATLGPVFDALKRSGSPGYGSGMLNKAPQQLQDLASQITNAVHGSIPNLMNDPKNAGLKAVWDMITNYTRGTL